MVGRQRVGIRQETLAQKIGHAGIAGEARQRPVQPLAIGVHLDAGAQRVGARIAVGKIHTAPSALPASASWPDLARLPTPNAARRWHRARRPGSRRAASRQARRGRLGAQAKTGDDDGDAEFSASSAARHRRSWACGRHRRCGARGPADCFRSRRDRRPGHGRHTPPCRSRLAGAAGIGDEGAVGEQAWPGWRRWQSRASRRGRCTLPSTVMVRAPAVRAQSALALVSAKGARGAGRDGRGGHNRLILGHYVVRVSLMAPLRPSHRKRCYGHLPRQRLRRAGEAGHDLVSGQQKRRRGRRLFRDAGKKVSPLLSVCPAVATVIFPLSRSSA